MKIYRKIRDINLFIITATLMIGLHSKESHSIASPKESSSSVAPGSCTDKVNLNSDRFKEVHECTDVKLDLEKFLSRDMYKNIFTPTSEIDVKIIGQHIERNKFTVALSTGNLIFYEKNKIVSVSSIKNLMPFFYHSIKSDSDIIKSASLLKRVYWISKNQFLIFYIGKENNFFHFYLTLADTRSSIKAISTFRLPGNIDTNQAFSLGINGGGIAREGKYIYLALGASSGPTKKEPLAQDRSSIFGKVLKISLSDLRPSIKNTKNYPDVGNLKYEIYSTGHRNPQGLLSIGNAILSVEHGPRGGDEINQIISGGNYGWADFSYGEDYGGDATKYKKYKSSLIDPIFYFAPSIGISDLTRCPKIFISEPFDEEKRIPCIVISSLVGKSFLFIRFGKESPSDLPEFRVISVNKIDLGKRIRRIEEHQDSLYLFTDDLTIWKVRYQLTSTDMNNGLIKKY